MELDRLCGERACYADAGYRDHTAGIACFNRPARMRPDHDNIGDDSDWVLVYSMG